MPTKDEFRQAARARRDAEPGLAALSAAIRRRVASLPEYRGASVVAAYVGVNSEVATRELIEARLEAGRPTAVVYRRDGELALCYLESLAELEPASFGLWEPRIDLRDDPARRCAASDVDLYLVPGLAFDREGGRIGYGRGYYDRLLRAAGGRALFLALAFECQLVDSVPMTDRDVRVHLVVTEREVHRVPPPAGGAEPGP